MMVELDTTMEENNNTSVLDNKEVSDASWGRLKTLNPLFPHYYIQNEECIFGRNSACQVFFTDKRISSKHCRVYRKKDEGQVDYRFYIDDYSSNGTFVNRKRVGKGNTVPIVNGNEISLSTVVDPEDPSRIMYIFEDLEQMRTKEMLERENNESGFTQNVDDSEIISLADMSPIKKGNSNLSTASSDSIKTDQFNTTSTTAINTTTDVTPIKKTTSTTTALPSSSSDNNKVLKRKSSEMDTSVDEGTAKKKLQTSNDQSSDSTNTDDNNNNNNTTTTTTTTNIPTTTTTTTTTNTPTKKQEIDIEETIGENLICGICQDIIHKCLTLIPCMHNFCVCCYGDWRAGSIECPQCRQPVKSAQKNHAINNLIELYLKKNPEKIRDPEELESMDKRCKITDEMLKKGLLNKSARKYEDDYDEDDEYYDEDDEDEDEEYLYPKCTFCSPNPPNATTGYQCAVGAQHLNCANCYKMFPKEPIEPPGIRCGFCTKSYCNLYQQCALGGNFGKMKDLPINMIPNDALGGNQFEIKIVSDYLSKNNKTVRQLYLDVLNDIETKKLVIPANANIILPADPITEQLRCLGCASAFFSKALFYYRLAIPKDQLPDYAQKRDPCYYGRNCRTQFSKFDHAKRLDHICDQTKF